MLGCLGFIYSGSKCGLDNPNVADGRSKYANADAYDNRSTKWSRDAPGPTTARGSE